MASNDLNRGTTAAFTWSSERDGWRHLYQVPRSGGPARLVTPGAFDAAIVAIDTTPCRVYYATSPENPTQSYLYRSPLRGPARAERITPATEPGSHYYSISPGGRWAFHTWSFTSPDVYRMGMAVAPVSDKRYYDTIYQERYMGLPATNVDGYRRASAVPFAKNLKADLLIVHGSGDDNVHYQNTEAVVNALVAANKPFTMMVYPNRTHCICEGENTSVHLFTMLTRYVDEHLGGGSATQAR